MNHRSKLSIALLAALATGLTAGALQSADSPDPTKLYETARERYAQVGTYIARLTRYEVVKGKRRPDELILLKVRDRPLSLYMKWIGKEGSGREGVYVKGQHGNKVHARLAAGDVPLMPAGMRMAVAPEGSLMKSASTHPITELGIGASLNKIGEVLASSGRKGELKTVGPRWLEEFGTDAYGIEHHLPPKMDPALPAGGRRTYWIDPATALPTLVTSKDEQGREVEYYRYDRLQLSVGLDDEDFDPDRLWKMKPVKGRS